MNATKNSMSSVEDIFSSSPETFIHPTAIVGPSVHIEPGVKIGPFCIIMGNVTIGAQTRLYGHVSIGMPAQNLGTIKSYGSIHIGNNCHLREFVTIHASKYDDGKTIIGDNCYIMNYGHISHDVQLGNNVTMINSVNLGGHTVVGNNVMLMANSATHQFCKIGDYAALAPFSGTRQDLPPYSLFNGQPAGFSGLNVIGLKRAGLTTTDLCALKHVSKLFYQDKLLLDAIAQKIASSQEYANNKYVQSFLSFIQTSSRGVSRRTLKDVQPENEAL